MDGRITKGMSNILNALLPGRAAAKDAAPKPKRINLALQAAVLMVPSLGACWSSF